MKINSFHIIDELKFFLLVSCISYLLFRQKKEAIFIYRRNSVFEWIDRQTHNENRCAKGQCTFCSRAGKISHVEVQLLEGCSGCVFDVECDCYFEHSGNFKATLFPV